MDWTFLREPFEQAAKSNWEQVSYVATVVAAIPVGMSALWFFFNRRAAQKAQEEENALEEKENQIRQEDNYLELDEHYRIEQRWYADYLREGKSHQDTELIHFSNIVNLLEKGFMLFHKPDDPQFSRMWNTWRDYIDEVVADPAFRKALVLRPNLLVGEDADFAVYIQERIENLAPKLTEGAVDYVI